MRKWCLPRPRGVEAHPLGGRCGRIAHHQIRPQPDLLFRCAWICDLRQQQSRRLCAQQALRNAHRGERRSETVGEGHVVESGHRDFARAGAASLSVLGHRPARRARRILFRADFGGAVQYQRRQAARDCGEQRQALQLPAQCAYGGGVRCSRFRIHALVRHVGSGRRAREYRGQDLEGREPRWPIPACASAWPSSATIRWK